MGIIDKLKGTPKWKNADPVVRLEGLREVDDPAVFAEVLDTDVHREGITGISAADISSAHELGYIVKLLAIVEERDGRIGARVHPTMVPEHHPLASVRESFNAIFIEGEATGEVMLYGRGAGGFPTASAVLGDIIDAAKNLRSGSRGATIGTLVRREILPIADVRSQYYLEVEAAVAELHPELVLGTQMERHIAKRLGVPCAVISGPFHVQDVPARHSPQMGWEGSNVIFDAWVHPLMMGLEEHLLHMFRDDFEFHGDAAPSHLHAPARAETSGIADSATQRVVEQPVAKTASVGAFTPPIWTPDGEKELGKIPFFVRGKARRNTEKFAAAQGILQITVDTLYEAKAHYGK